MKANTSEQARPADVGEPVAAAPDILAGKPAFRGTRVPLAPWFEHLNGNARLASVPEVF